MSRWTRAAACEMLARMRSDAALARDVVPVGLLPLAADGRLVAQVQTGSEQAFEALFERHREPLLGFCHQMLGSRDDAEDVVQQTFLVAYGELTAAVSPRALRPWLYGIARHRCLTLLRARRKRSIEDAPEPATNDVATEVTAREELRAILSDVARLPDDQRATLVLAELGGVSYEEIALLLHCPRAKVKALAYQARSSLAAGRCARETPCAEVREQLATLRGAALRRASLRRHLRDCAGCRMFREEVRARRGRMGVVPPLPLLAGLKRLVLGCLGREGAGAVALGGSTLSGAGLVATALVTVAVPIGGMAVALSRPQAHRQAERTSAPAPVAAAGIYGVSPAHPVQYGIRVEAPAARNPRTRGGDRADAPPPKAVGSDTPTPSTAAGSDGGRQDPGQALAPGPHAAPPTSDAAEPASPAPPPSAGGGRRPDTPPAAPPAGSRSPPAPARPVAPGAPPEPRGNPGPRLPENPTPPSHPAPPPAPPGGHVEAPPAAQPPDRPGPTTHPTPPSPPASTPGGP